MEHSSKHLSLEARVAIVVADIENGLTLESRIAIEKEHGVCRHYSKQCKEMQRNWFVQTRKMFDMFIEQYRAKEC